MSDDLKVLADESAVDARAYLTTMTEVASGSAPDAAIPMTLLALSQALVMGARLGAIEDIVPVERFETDTVEAELDPLRTGVANLFEGLDEYADVVDPVTSTELTTGSLSNDVTVVAGALSHGLRHYDQGRISEALWWWQFSYLSVWGDQALASMRALHSILSHLRLDADEERVSEAEFDALHP